MMCGPVPHNLAGNGLTRRPICEPCVVREVSSPSPQPSPSGRGRHVLRLSSMLGAPGLPTRCRRFSLSLWERVGVRGNALCFSPECRMTPRTPELLEPGSAGRFQRLI